MGEAFYKSALLGEVGGREGAARAVKAKKTLTSNKERGKKGRGN